MNANRKAFYSIEEAAILWAKDEGVTDPNDPLVDYYGNSILESAKSRELPVRLIERDIPTLPGGFSCMDTNPSWSSTITATKLRQWMQINFPNAKPAFLFGESISQITYRNGTAGRPTSWHLIQSELERRWKKGERYPGNGGGFHKQNITIWTKILSTWLKQTHPEANHPKGKTLPNKLSSYLISLK